MNALQERLNRAVTRGDTMEVAIILGLINEAARHSYEVAASFPCPLCDAAGIEHTARCSRHPDHEGYLP